LNKMFKRALIAVTLAFAFMLATPVAAQAAASVTSFHMDRTTVAPGQTVVITVNTSAQTSHVFAEIGGIRTQGVIAQTTAAGVRVWTITVAPPAGATRVDIFANTSNTTVGAVALSIPITVTGTAPQQPNQPGTAVPAGPMAIASVTEITALRANTVRLEIITGVDVTEVWASINNNSRWPRATRVSSTANSQTWHLELAGLNPLLQTIQVSANRGFFVNGATNRNHTITNAAPFVAPAVPMIANATANPSTVVFGGNTTINVTTNADVNHVWVMVGNTRVNATRVGTAATGPRNWTAVITPSTTGNVVVHANATDTPTGAITRNVWIEASQTRVSISHASAQWVPAGAAAGARTGVRIVVHTNLYATDLWVRSGGHSELQLTQHTISGNTRIWDQTIAIGNFAENVPIHIRANDWSNIFTGTGNDVHASLTGVGGVMTHVHQGQQGIVWNASFNPAHLSRDMFWPITATFTTANDVTEVRVRDASGAMLTHPVTNFVEGANNTRIWTVSNIIPIVPTGANSVLLNIDIRRGTSAWIPAPAISVPVMN